eukprot:RCo036893
MPWRLVFVLVLQTIVCSAEVHSGNVSSLSLGWPQPRCVCFGASSAEINSLNEERRLKGSSRRLRYVESTTTPLREYDPVTGVAIWDMFVPDYVCLSAERIGIRGHWSCSLAKLELLFPPKGSAPVRKNTVMLAEGIPPCVVYHFGYMGNSDVAQEVLTRTACEVHLFDPSEAKMPAALKRNYFPSRVRFHKFRLRGETQPVESAFNSYSLLDIMALLNHTFVDWLIIDRQEGSDEWNIMNSLSNWSFPFAELSVALEVKPEVIPGIFRIFRSVEDRGFRLFSKETLVAGNRDPGAATFPSVFSFIHLGAFRSPLGRLPITVQHYGGIKKLIDVRKSALEASQPKGVICFLSRRERLSQLMNALQRLYAHFLSLYPHYPVMIFHEDFMNEEKQALFDLFPRISLRFHRVDWKFPEHFDRSTLPAAVSCPPKTSVGYRHMCRFHAMEVHTILSREWEWHWRLDDDSYLLGDIGYDVFRFMEENKMLYGFAGTAYEDENCIEGFYDAVNSFLTKHPEIPVGFYKAWPRNTIVYNNFELSHRSVFESQVYQSFFDHVDRTGRIFTHRWGDAPIKTVGVSLAVPASKVHRFSDIGYIHRPFLSQSPGPLPATGGDPVAKLFIKRLPFLERDIRYKQLREGLKNMFKSVHGVSRLRIP